MKPRALDLYCKAGGAARGLERAGFQVSGVDCEPQPNYPYEFFLADVLEHLDPEWITANFDFVWASPPCQANSALRHAPNAKAHKDLIPQTRELLRRTALPYAIENVEGAASLNANLTLCGSMFGLGTAGYQLRRHRLFETSFPVEQPECRHQSPVIGVYGGHVRCRSAKHGGRRTRDFESFGKAALAADALGLPRGCMTMGEYSNAIPPAYSCYIGEFAKAHILEYAP